MKIANLTFYDGAKAKISRLGIAPLFLELLEILTQTSLRVEEKRDANGGKPVRQLIDASFEKSGGWQKTQVGGVDWIKTNILSDVYATTLGVEVQVSARSDLLVRDVVHLRRSIENGDVDVGVIVVPSDLLQIYLPDRTPCYKDVTRYIESEFREAVHYPLDRKSVV